MTPYSLERRLETHRKEIAFGGKKLTPEQAATPVVAMLVVISETLEMILEHLADVEGEATLARHHAGSD